MLSINHFSKQYAPGRYAVQDLTLAGCPRRDCGFLGHNGAASPPPSALWRGCWIHRGGYHHRRALHPHRAGAAKQAMAFLPDNPDLYDFLTGIQYLNLLPTSVPSRRMCGPPASRSLPGLCPDRDLGSPIGSYSHGMKQKLALIRFGPDPRPRLLLLDEPFVGLDPNAALYPQADAASALPGRRRGVFAPPTCWRWRKSSATSWPS